MHMVTTEEHSHLQPITITTMLDKRDGPSQNEREVRIVAFCVRILLRITDIKVIFSVGCHSTFVWSKFIASSHFFEWKRHIFSHQTNITLR